MRKNFILIAFAIVILSGCSAVSVPITNVAPPKSGTPEMTRLMILPFDNDEGGRFTAALTNVIGQLRYDGKPAYTVLDRASMSTILKEMEFQMTMADPNTVIEFGNMLGAEGAITGGVVYSGDSRNVQEERTRQEPYYVTVYKSQGANRPRVPVQELRYKYVDYYVTCTEGFYNLSVSMNVTDFTTTQVNSNSYSRSVSTRSCPDASTSVQRSGYEYQKNNGLGEERIMITNLPSGSSTYDDMAADILTEIAKQLGEYTLTYDVELAKSDDTLDNDDKKIFTSGYDFAKEGNIQRACELWQGLERSNPDAPYLAYNLGICMETTGEDEWALQYYNKALKLVTKPDEKITDSINRLNVKKAQGII